MWTTSWLDASQTQRRTQCSMNCQSILLWSHLNYARFILGMEVNYSQEGRIGAQTVPIYYEAGLKVWSKWSLCGTQPYLRRPGPNSGWSTPGNERHHFVSQNGRFYAVYCECNATGHKLRDVSAIAVLGPVTTDALACGSTCFALSYRSTITRNCVQEIGRQ